MRRKVYAIPMREFLVGEVLESGKTYQVWIRAKNEDDALRVYAWLTDSVGDYFVAASRPSRI